MSNDFHCDSEEFVCVPPRVLPRFSFEVEPQLDWFIGDRLSVSGKVGSSGSVKVGKSFKQLVEGKSGSTGEVTAGRAVLTSAEGKSSSAGSVTARAIFEINVVGKARSTGNVKAGKESFLSVSGSSSSKGEVDASRSILVSATGQSGSKGSVQAGKETFLSVSGQSASGGSIDAAGVTQVSVSGQAGSAGSVSFGVQHFMDISGKSRSMGSLTVGKQAFESLTGEASSKGTVSATRSVEVQLNGQSGVKGESIQGAQKYLDIAGQSGSVGTVQAGKDNRLQVSGNSSSTGSVEKVVEAPPPTFTITYTTSTNSYTLEWEPDPDRVGSYHIYHNGSLEAVVDSDIGSYEITGLDPGTEHEAFVRAVNEFGSTDSNTVNPITDVSSPTASCTGGEGQITVSWTSTGQYYDVERSTDELTWSTIVSKTPNTSISDSDVTPETTYYYRVIAFDENQQNPSSPSNTTSCQAEEEEPDPPTTTIEPNTPTINTFPSPGECDGSFNCTWGNQSTQWDIEIFVERTDELWADSHTYSSGTTSHLQENACSGGTYRFRGRYFNDGGNGPWSDWSPTITM